MKEIVKFFLGRRYSAVSTSEMQVMGQNQTKCRNSLKTKPSLNRGHDIVDAFFHERKPGKKTRCPKCELNPFLRVLSFEMILAKRNRIN